jgi:predicted membrane protein
LFGANFGEFQLVEAAEMVNDWVAWCRIEIFQQIGEIMVDFTKPVL